MGALFEAGPSGVQKEFWRASSCGDGALHQTCVLQSSSTSLVISLTVDLRVLHHQNQTWEEIVAPQSALCLGRSPSSLPGEEWNCRGLGRETLSLKEPKMRTCIQWFQSRWHWHP